MNESDCGRGFEDPTNTDRGKRTGTDATAITPRNFHIFSANVSRPKGRRPPAILNDCASSAAAGVSRALCWAARDLSSVFGPQHRRRARLTGSATIGQMSASFRNAIELRGVLVCSETYEGRGRIDVRSEKKLLFDSNQLKSPSHLIRQQRSREVGARREKRKRRVCGSDLPSCTQVS